MQILTYEGGIEGLKRKYSNQKGGNIRDMLELGKWSEKAHYDIGKTWGN